MARSCHSPYPKNFDAGAFCDNHCQCMKIWIEKWYTVTCVLATSFVLLSSPFRRPHPLIFVHVLISASRSYRVVAHIHAVAIIKCRRLASESFCPSDMKRQPPLRINSKGRGSDDFRSMSNQQCASEMDDCISSEDRRGQKDCTQLIDHCKTIHCGY